MHLSVLLATSFRVQPRLSRISLLNPRIMMRLSLIMRTVSYFKRLMRIPMMLLLSLTYFQAVAYIIHITTGDGRFSANPVVYDRISTANEEARKLFDAKFGHKCEPEVTADDYGFETITVTSKLPAGAFKVIQTRVGRAVIGDCRVDMP